MMRWKLRQYLDENELSAYALTKAADVAPNTVYALARGDQRRLDLEVLDKVLTGLEKLTGESVDVADLLERDRVAVAPDKLTAAGVPYTGDPETDWWLDNQPDILERIRKLEAGESKLIPWEQVKAEQRAKRGL